MLISPEPLTEPNPPAKALTKSSTTNGPRLPFYNSTLLLTDAPVSLQDGWSKLRESSAGTAITLRERSGNGTHLVREALQLKVGGQNIMDQYMETKTISDRNRRSIVNLVVAKMIEDHGRTPPVSVRIKYALGIITLFPCLRDPYTDNGFEHFYDPRGGSGYLAWRLKTCQRNTVPPKRPSSNIEQEVSPKRKRLLQLEDQLFGDDCQEAIAMLKHSTNPTIIKEKMRATFQYRQSLVHDHQGSFSILDVFTRFLDTPGLIDQDFEMMFGEEVSSRFVSKWPTFFKPRILAECKNLNNNDRLGELMDDRLGWDSDMSSVLLLVHMLPPTPKGYKRSGRISSTQAADHLVKYLQIGVSIDTFLAGVEPGQPFLLCMGNGRNNIQRFYVIVDHKALPCKAETSLAAFDELFKAHFIFSLNYEESLTNFYTFMQTTVYNIDVGSAKENPRVKELRAKILNADS
ncbi:hypothetical protein WMY93_020106 [Mugilogobius chulae]|uniref:Uncharacterized protein n=1 Tax=Mugilogobius chulae TaxID=88201 RepID=A0AAW0NJ18_9GOBI